MFLFLRTQNPGLREVDLEPSPKRGRDKINMVKQGTNTHNQSNGYHGSALGYKELII